MNTILENEIKKIKSNYSLGSPLWNVEFLNSFILNNINIHDSGKSTLLDIGCGPDSLVRYNNLILKTGLDAWKPSIKQARSNNTHQELIECKFEEISKKLGNKEYDFIIAIDFIEHLDKEAGEQLIKYMKEHCRIGAAIYTPNGFLYQPSLESGDFQLHKSGWIADDFKSHGFKVAGGAGLKFLRKEFHQIKYRPMVFWQMISYLSQILFTNKHPKYASALWATYLKQ